MITPGISIPEPADRGAQAGEADSSSTFHAHGRIKRWLPQIARFITGQGSLQAVNLLAGFLLIRCLDVDNYALYSLTTGFQGTVGVLAELGLGGSIVALLAGRTDPTNVGRYLRSTTHYRDRF